MSIDKVKAFHQLEAMPARPAAEGLNTKDQCLGNNDNVALWDSDETADRILAHLLPGVGFDSKSDPNVIPIGSFTVTLIDQNDRRAQELHFIISKRAKAKGLMKLGIWTPCKT